MYSTPQASLVVLHHRRNCISSLRSRRTISSSARCLGAMSPCRVARQLCARGRKHLTPTCSLVCVARMTRATCLRTQVFCTTGFAAPTATRPTRLQCVKLWQRTLVRRCTSQATRWVQPSLARWRTFYPWQRRARSTPPFSHPRFQIRVCRSATTKAPTF